jgi:hypothetical protein
MKKMSSGQTKSDGHEVDDLLTEYDFDKLQNAAPPHRFKEGERVEINGALFIVKGRGFVPDPAGKDSDNGKRPRKKK